MILRYSYLAALHLANEVLWQRTSPQSHIDLESDEPRFEGDLPALFQDFYRLEYIYSNLKTKPFEHNERMHENVLKKVTQVFTGVVDELLELFISVFQKWLSAHALTNPSQWAQARMGALEGGDYGLNEMWDTIVSEFADYNSNIRELSIPTQRLQMHGKQERILIERLCKLPGIEDELWGIIGGKDQYVESEVSSALEEFDSDPNDTLERFNLPEDTDREQAEQLIAETLQNTSIQEILDSYDPADLLKNADPDTQTRIMSIAFQDIIFPLWFRFWKAQGIEQTRANVERAYSFMQNAQTLGEKYAAVNIATNTGHQTGDMLEYICEATEAQDDPKELKTLLSSLTSGNFTKELDPVLRESGVQI